MDIKEIKKISKKELKMRLTEKRSKLRKFKFDVESRHLKNVRAIRKVKKDIARISTILNKAKKIK
ncbi:MAG: 50S ribosomal protein L29 [Xanthomonadaceae bacterium]|nr:50S ribosomal protein L29 [Rhodospirillaceae bacterium]NIA17822.1 50S ribosomal protein L29 [Xanthomonadaceae bacterium]